MDSLEKQRRRKKPVLSEHFQDKVGKKVGKVSMTHYGEVHEDMAGKWTDADYIAH